MYIFLFMLCKYNLESSSDCFTSCKVTLQNVLSDKNSRSILKLSLETSDAEG